MRVVVLVSPEGLVGVVMVTVAQEQPDVVPDAARDAGGYAVLFGSGAPAKSAPKTEQPTDKSKAIVRIYFNSLIAIFRNCTRLGGLVHLPSRFAP